MRNITITVITVVFNDKTGLEKTIQSVISQTYPQIEYIVIDGGSTDGTIEIIKKYANYLSKWISESDKGVYDAMNKGIKMATGDYIIFMNAGDLFYNSNVIENVVDRICGTPSVIFGDVASYQEGVLYHELAKPFYEHLPLHHTMGFNHQSTFVRTDLAKNNPFDLKYNLASDYNMIIQIYKQGGTFLQLKDLIIALYDRSGLSEKKRCHHIYETLMIDNPDKRIRNIFISRYIYVSRKLKSYIGRVLFELRPSYMLNRRKTKRNIIVIDQ